jgi:hypothetical protein
VDETRREKGESLRDWVLRRRDECNRNAASDAYKQSHGEESQLLQAGRAFGFSEMWEAMGSPAMGHEVDREAVRDTVRNLESSVIHGLACGPVEIRIKTVTDQTVFRFPPDFTAAQRALYSALVDYIAACHKTSRYKASIILDEHFKDNDHRDILEARWEACGQQGHIKLTPPHPREYIEDWNEADEEAAG